jgi:cystathionine gamma-lyase
MRFSTKAIRVGQQPDPTTGSVIVPVYQTVNFTFQDVGRPHAYEYSRSANPTRTALEQCLAALEEARFGLAFSSGMAAVDGVLSLLRPGDHVVSAEHIYGGTFRLFEQVYRPRGVSFTYVDGTRPEAFAKAILPATKLVWIETPANPLLQLVDVRAVAKIAHDRGVKLVADNTFPSPYFQRPLTQGADIVLHSTTKYVSGHSDVIGGAVVTSDERLYQAIKFYQNAAGAVPGAWDCWLSLRGLKTLAVRMKQHEANARVVAEFLEKHPKVQETIYPGLAGHPQHELAKAQMDGFGAIVTFRLNGGEQVRQFVKGLKLFLFAESLGGVESLACHPATMSHATLTPEERQRIGITDGTMSRT